MHKYDMVIRSRNRHINAISTLMASLFAGEGDKIGEKFRKDSRKPTLSRRFRVPTRKIRVLFYFAMTSFLRILATLMMLSFSSSTNLGESLSSQSHQIGQTVSSQSHQIRRVGDSNFLSNSPER